MAEARSEKPASGRNAFDSVTFSQPPRQPKQEQVPLQPPITNLIVDTTERPNPKTENTPSSSKAKKSPAPLSEDSKPEPKDKITVMLPVELIERLRNAAYWNRTTLAALAEDGILQVLAKLERDNGGAFEERDGALKTGRPMGSRNTTRK